MKKRLLTILQITSHTYEIKVFDLFTSWCAKKTKDQRALQKFLTCPTLFNWWYKELQALEIDFLIDTEAFGSSLSKHLASDFYDECIADIHLIYSKPLMKKAHDTKSITKQD